MKKMPNKTIGLLLLMLLALFLLSIDRSMLLTKRIFAESIEQKVDRGRDINILLMGIDARPGETTVPCPMPILAEPSVNKDL